MKTEVAPAPGLQAGSCGRDRICSNRSRSFLDLAGSIVIACTAGRIAEDSALVWSSQTIIYKGCDDAIRTSAR